MLIDKEILGKILVVAGAILFFIGTLFIGGGPFDQLALTMGWLFGAILFVVGLVLGFELWTYSTTRGKLSVFLMSVSAVLVITALILFSFATFDIIFTGTVEELYSRGEPIPNVFIERIRPYRWALTPLSVVALFLFVAGLLLKLYDSVL